jgi:RNA polymerase sigma-70 factor (ECF subfamily)
MELPADTRPQAPPSGADGASQELLRRLGSQGSEREEAVGELHVLPLKAARFEIGRRSPSLPHLRGDDLDDLAQQSADDALVAVLAKLGSFRGESRFTTWAYKFALLEAAVKLRRRAWQGREIPLEDDAWAALASAATVERGAEDSELFAAIREEIEFLSLRQREVMIAIAINDVPIDVLAERLGATRGALYKTLHDARRKLRARLAARGLWPDDGGEENR